MVYQVNVFQNWVNMASWEALKAHLQSKEGGSLRVVEPKDSPYALVRYNKATSDFSQPHVRWCRSVVVHKESRLPVSVAPPKAEELMKDTMDVVTVAEEFVDGTMVNVFQYGEDQQVATRSRIGGNTRFYEGAPTFQTMLEEALRIQQLNTIGSILPLRNDALAKFTSVVLQHPDNRIVKAVTAPAVYVVHQGHVTADGLVFIEEDAGEFTHGPVTGDEIDLEIQPYTLTSIAAAKSVKDWVNTQSSERGYGWQGVVLKDGAGRRWRQRSDVYETVRKLRGNESAANERYARLRKARAVDQYLIFYPEDRERFYELEGLLRKNTRQLLHFYGDVFRARKTAFHELPWPYKHHVSVLHNLYKDKLRAEQKKIDLDQTVRYVNGLNVDDTVNMLKTHRLELKVKTEEAAQA